MTFGTEVEVTSAVGFGSTQPIDDDQVMLAYSDTTTVYVRKVSVSGTTLIVDSAVTVQSSVGLSNQRVSLDRMGSQTFVAGYYAQDTGSSIKTNGFRIIDSNGTATPSLIGSEKTFTVGFNGVAQTPAAVYLSPVRCVVAYYETAGGDETDIRTLDFEHNYASYIGIAKTGVASGVDVKVILNGKSDDVTGLTAGEEYNVDMDGALIGNDLGSVRRVGVALSSTEIVVQS